MDVSTDNRFIYRIKERGRHMSFMPCIPAEWKTFTMTYRFVDTNYHIQFIQSEGEKQMEIFEDDKKLKDGIIALVNDSKTHEVRIEL